jgi:hypothetical protein
VRGNGTKYLKTDRWGLKKKNEESAETTTTDEEPRSPTRKSFPSKERKKKHNQTPFSYMEEK